MLWEFLKHFIQFKSSRIKISKLKTKQADESEQNRTLKSVHNSTKFPKCIVDKIMQIWESKKNKNSSKLCAIFSCTFIKSNLHWRNLKTERKNLFRRRTRMQLWKLYEQCLDTLGDSRGCDTETFRESALRRGRRWWLWLILTTNFVVGCTAADARRNARDAALLPTRRLGDP